MSQIRIPRELSSVVDLMLDPLSLCLDVDSARRVFELRIDPAVQERAAVLAEKANEGLLTDAERAEYETYINTDDFIAILKLKARRRIASRSLSLGFWTEPALVERFARRLKSLAELTAEEASLEGIDTRLPP